MNVSPSKPFQLVYSLFEHEYLGYLFESFVVEVNEHGNLTLSHQNISSKNAQEFASGLDNDDYELIKLMDSMQQDVIAQTFHKKKIKTPEFFLKIYGKDGNQTVQHQIAQYLEVRRSKILALIGVKSLFEMGSDGEPAWKRIYVQKEKATVLFHFRRNEDNTHYFPTIKHNGEKVEFQYRNAYIICNEPAWIVIEDKLYSFEKEVDGNKLKPFLNKKFILIPKKMEETYYKKFVTQLIASFDVYAKGFDIKSSHEAPKPQLILSELAVAKKELTLFDSGETVSEKDHNDDSKILFELQYQYGSYSIPADRRDPVSVRLEHQNDYYTFFKINRRLDLERSIAIELQKMGLVFRNGKLTLPKSEAFGWLALHQGLLEQLNFAITQRTTGTKRYYIGPSSIDLQVTENIDWFDIKAVIKFGEYMIPYNVIRKYILKKKREIELPNGEIAVIPETWFQEYSELFAFAKDGQEDSGNLEKHHLALIQELAQNQLAKVSINKKLEKLRDYNEIEDYQLPTQFSGELRPYQKAGYNWMRFLRSFNFGGCLADDMGLGKTVQTLALLQSLKEENQSGASLLVMPTSLIYNWEMEAKRFTPELKVLNYTGTNREKDVTKFISYDLVISSYGIVRLDINILQGYNFDYIILDESQAIKNPSSNIAQAVTRLKSKYRLILTGTPVENSTLDLWSQMSFVNPGLLGSQSFFKNEFLNPIEKSKNEKKTEKLHTIIKPFILRRNKGQVVKELPDKVENIKYCRMSPRQEEEYESVKSGFRNKILDNIEKDGMGKSRMLILQGLNKLRQIANHPKMVDPDYEGDSGKLEDIQHMLTSSISKGHKILVFSQFVKHLSIVRQYLDCEKISYAYLDGSTKNRMEQVENFQNDPSLSVFLISLKAGGVGLNLTKADYVLLLDPWWNPAVEAQAVDRAHRIGQENRVFTYKFITKNTVEEKILKLQESKIKLARDLISTEDSFVKNLTKEDIASLLD